LSSLTPDLETVLITLRYADRDVKAAEKKKKDARDLLFHIATVEGEKEVLPRRTQRLPVGFLNKIGMQEPDFIASRWPGWRKVESRKVNDDGEEDREGEWIEYLLERDPAYLPYTAETEDMEGITFTAGRTVQQNPPEIDQRTLQKDMPEVFKQIMRPVVVYEVNVEKLEKLLAERKDLLPKLELHFTYPPPIAKLAPIREQKQEEDDE
jgi:hypothetical protein